MRLRSWWIRAFPALDVRSLGLIQSACSPCDPLAHQIFRKSSSGIAAFSASRLALSMTVSVTGAFFAFRKASQSVHVWSETSSGFGTVEVGELRIVPLDLPPDSPLRSRFLSRWLSRDEAGYAAYWTVRRYVGKGAPPLEVASPAEVIRLVATRPGAVGYIDEADLTPGMNVVAR